MAEVMRVTLSRLPQWSARFVAHSGLISGGHIKPPRTFLGWVDLPTNEIPKATNHEVYVERSPSKGNLAHANILGIPDPNSEEWRLVALKLAKLATPLITAP